MANEIYKIDQIGRNKTLEKMYVSCGIINLSKLEESADIL